MTKFSNFGDIISFLLGLISLAIPVVAGLALLAFIWGLVKFISKSGDPKGNAEGKSLMIWGIIALFVMISFQALITIAQGNLGITPGTGLPTLPTSSTSK